MAVLAALAALTALVVLLSWHPAGILTVALALLVVLLGTVTGTAVAALRDRDARSEHGAAPTNQPDALLGGIDADTLDALDSEAVRSRLGGVSDR
ncbi:hypothetical protein GA0070614_2957 [Micromonospora coxensis]|uniref:Uncharacterized protein n=1 Tax=Micromonospora coxensis TaxID=356852 RepID=A0A1C5ILU6_9ACTN|nr:hypothetical protein GA0070614_2957 [Micromonospora coxensis]